MSSRPSWQGQLAEEQGLKGKYIDGQWYVPVGDLHDTLTILERAYADTVPGTSGRISAQNHLLHHNRDLPEVNY